MAWIQAESAPAPRSSKVGQVPDRSLWALRARAGDGGDGNITMVGETSPGKYEPVATITTQRGARTIGADQKAHKLYLPAAEYGPAPAPKDGNAGRPVALPDSFEIIVVGR